MEPHELMPAVIRERMPTWCAKLQLLAMWGDAGRCADVNVLLKQNIRGGQRGVLRATDMAKWSEDDPVPLGGLRGSTGGMVEADEDLPGASAGRGQTVPIDRKRDDAAALQQDPDGSRRQEGCSDHSAQVRLFDLRRGAKGEACIDEVAHVGPAMWSIARNAYQMGGELKRFMSDTAQG